MNKTKKVAWRKHRIKAKKYKERSRQAKASGAPATTTGRR